MKLVKRSLINAILTKLAAMTHSEVRDWLTEKVRPMVTDNQYQDVCELVAEWTRGCMMRENAGNILAHALGYYAIQEDINRELS